MFAILLCFYFKETVRDLHLHERIDHIDGLSRIRTIYWTFISICLETFGILLQWKEIGHKYASDLSREMLPSPRFNTPDQSHLSRRLSSSGFCPKDYLDLHRVPIPNIPTFFPFEYASIDRFLWGTLPLFSCEMKLRTSPSRPLRRLLLPQTSRSTNHTSRRGACLQCQQQINGRSVRSSASRTALQSRTRPTSSASTRAFALPATLIAGQRRGLATVQNGLNNIFYRWRLTN
jgi:hypothetical protein